MSIDDMLELVSNGENSPAYEVIELLDSNNFMQATIVIKDYLNCDENTAKIVCMDFKTKVYDELMKPDTTLTPQQIAHNNEVAREWQNKPKCPTCNSQNLKKISTTSKAVNAIAFGIFGTKRNKTFHCNNCGYEW